MENLVRPKRFWTFHWVRTIITLSILEEHLKKAQTLTDSGKTGEGSEAELAEPNQSLNDGSDEQDGWDTEVQTGPALFPIILWNQRVPLWVY